MFSSIFTEDGEVKAPAVVELPQPEVIENAIDPTITDPTNPAHWSKDEKYDTEACLEAPYKKHLGRHANKWVCKHQPSVDFFSYLNAIRFIMFLTFQSIWTKINTSFRVLLRVRMLYYIKHEVIGDCVKQILDGVNVA